MDTTYGLDKMMKQDQQKEDKEVYDTLVNKKPKDQIQKKTMKYFCTNEPYGRHNPVAKMNLNQMIHTKKDPHLI